MDPVEALNPASCYVPSPTCATFINAVRHGPVNEMRVLILRSARGEGKTSAGLWACMALAERLAAEHPEALPLRVAVVRDFWVNLERTTLPTFEENARLGVELEWLNGRREAVIASGGIPFVHFWFFGVDRPDDADKFQGFQSGVLWLEEVAPAAGVASGVPASVFGTGALAVRQSHVPPRVIITMNPPDKNHWILRVEEHLAGLGLRDVVVSHFVIPSGERSVHFRALAAMGEGEAWNEAADAFDAYRTRNRAFLEAVGRHDLVARLVEGEIGEVRLGTAVVPNFSRALHVAKEPLAIVRGLEVIRGIDAGINDLHPACCWIQCGSDWLNVLGSRVGSNIGIEEFVRREVWPFERKYRLMKPRGVTSFGPGARQGFRFRNIADPAVFQTEGQRSARTAAMVLEEMLKEAVEPGPVEWAARREALFAAFNRKGPGDRMFIAIDPDENEILIDGLAGRFSYPEHHETGEPIADIAAAKRHSGRWGHPVDALAYPLAVLYPAYDLVRQQMREPVPKSPRSEGGWLGR